jgi:molybdate transport system substrate-binding protein
MIAMRVRWLLPCLILAAGCGGGGSPPLRVAAASSLKAPFTALGGAQFSFAGSDQLAAQIRSGARPDVFAAANTTLPDALYADGLVERPVAFAGNRLVLAVARDSKIARIEDLERQGVAIAMGSASVPVGAYTLKVLARLPSDARAAILHNVRSREPDVAGVIGKLTEGAVDAGFVYVTDVAATGGKARAIELPRALRPDVVYEAAVVRGTTHVDRARAFVRGLLGGKGAAELRRAGFAPPP